VARVDRRMGPASLNRFMSAKGCSLDNAVCEGLFERLKKEMLYGVFWKGVSLQQFISVLDSFLNWYNRERIKESLGRRSSFSLFFSNVLLKSKSRRSLFPKAFPIL